MEPTNWHSAQFCKISNTFTLIFCTMPLFSIQVSLHYFLLLLEKTGTGSHSAEPSSKADGLATARGKLGIQQCLPVTLLRSFLGLG